MTLSSFHSKGYFIFILLIIFSFSAYADNKPETMGHGPGHGAGHMDHHAKPGHHKQGGHHGKGKGMHLFGPHWKSTLTDKQRSDIDMMHLKLMKVQAPLKAKIKALKVEIGLLITSENPNMKTIDSKIDALLKLKKEKMRSKLTHKIEMRKILTPDQRVSFDMGVIQKSLQSKQHKGH